MAFPFSLTKEDYIAFNLYTYGQSHTLQRSLLLIRLMGLIYLVLPFVMFWITGEFLPGFFILFAILAVLWFLYIPRYYHWSTRRRLHKMLNEKETQSLFGEMTLYLTAEGLRDEKPSGEVSKVPWSGVNKIGETDNYLFFYVNPVAAYILPKRAVQGDQGLSVLKATIPSYIRSV